ncbi:MAG: hypothetical protein M0Q13_02675 [Methanothrix sp.]|jgi:hypothetical protein|nr:hypothetical protein [Methanothrix sp.]
MNKYEYSILNISDSPLFQEINNSINIERYQHNIDDYKNMLEDAIKQGIAVIINGSEPTDKELIIIKKTLDKMGKVKIFRKRKKIFNKDIFIKPSVFHTLSVSKINEEEAEEIKKRTINYINSLINND